MARSFWDSYQAFLQAAQAWTNTDTEHEAVQAVRVRIRTQPELFASWAAEHGWGRAYVERHFLYVAGDPEEVRELLRRGYPVRRIPRKTADLAALAAALGQADWREEVDHLFGRHTAPDWTRRAVWIYRSSPALRAHEGLAQPVAEALIERACPPGGFVVDPMAGSGAVVRAARATARRAWGGDLAPSSPDVVHADVHHLARHVAACSADLLVLHPPTFRAWALGTPGTQALAGLPASEQYAAYLDFVVDLLASVKGSVKAGGRVVLIARPARQGHVFNAPYELALGEQGLDLLEYRLAVSDDGQDDWHFFIARGPLSPVPENGTKEHHP